MTENLLNHQNNSSTEEAIIHWEKEIQAMLDQMVVDMNLPDKSLYLATNYGRDGVTITSYSICIYEPEFPSQHKDVKDSTRSSTVLRYKVGKEKIELMIGRTQFESLEKPENAEIKQKKSAPNFIFVTMIPTAKNFIPYIRENTKYALENYTSKAASFGCCSRFLECSDAKTCVHENKLYSKACIYRGNLEAGRIFYGKNRNVD